MNGAQLALIAGGLFLAWKFGLFSQLQSLIPGIPGNTTGANPSNPPSGTSVNQSASTQTQNTSSGSGPVPGSQAQNPQNPTPTPVVQPDVTYGADYTYGTGLSQDALVQAEQLWQTMDRGQIYAGAAAGRPMYLYLVRKYGVKFTPSEWNWYRSQAVSDYEGVPLNTLQTNNPVSVDQFLNALRAQGLAGANNMGRVNHRRVSRYVQ